MFPNVLGQHTIPFKPDTICMYIGVHALIVDDGSESGESLTPLFMGDVVERRDEDGDVINRGVIYYATQGIVGFRILLDGGVLEINTREEDDKNILDWYVVGNINDPANCYAPSKFLKKMAEMLPSDGRCTIVVRNPETE